MGKIAAITTCYLSIYHRVSIRVRVRVRVRAIESENRQN